MGQPNLQSKWGTQPFVRALSHWMRNGIEQREVMPMRVRVEPRPAEFGQAARRSCWSRRQPLRHARHLVLAVARFALDLARERAPAHGAPPTVARPPWPPGAALPNKRAMGPAIRIRVVAVHDRAEVAASPRVADTERQRTRRAGGAPSRLRTGVAIPPGGSARGEGRQAKMHRVSRWMARMSARAGACTGVR